jgi:predicted RNA-binding protein YlxR (DUF448 family)
MKQIRTCVICRKKFFQEELNRLQCENKNLIPFKGEGRSFYVCAFCVKDKKLIKYIAKICDISKEEAKKQILRFPFSIVN